MIDPSIQTLLQVAEAAADTAAEVLRKGRDRLRQQGKEGIGVRLKNSSSMDPVTAIDLAAQEKIISVIRERFPDHRFLAEEEGADALGDPDSPYLWIIDPLDGTKNFINGKQSFGTIVAVAKGEELFAGCMVLPILDQRFTGAKGLGAFFNGQPVKLRKTKGMFDATLTSNITRRAKPMGEGVLQVTFPACASVENYGCAAQEMGDILTGGNDGAFFRGLKLWDVAAGLVMLAEAGGKYRYEWIEKGNPRGGILCAASTPEIFDELSAFVFEKDHV